MTVTFYVAEKAIIRHSIFLQSTSGASIPIHSSVKRLMPKYLEQNPNESCFEDRSTILRFMLVLFERVLCIKILHRDYKILA